MVLDEEALEAMLRRQQKTDGDEPPAPAELTDVTDEFEVYERPTAPDPEAAPAPVQEADLPPATEEPPTAAATPAFTTPLDIVADEASPEHAPGPAPEPGTPEPMAPMDAPSKVEPASFLPPAFQETPVAKAERGDASEPGSTPAPAPTATPTADATHERRRPQVYPPIPGAVRSHAPDPTPVAAQAGHGGNGCRVALVQSTFNQEIVSQMAAAAKEAAAALGAQITHHVHVPGVYDLPLMAKTLAARDDVDTVVVVGAVVQGETNHDEVITHACAQALTQLAMETGKPIGFGVTGPGMTWDQALARIVNGKHAMEAAVAQWNALKTV